MLDPKVKNIIYGYIDIRDGMSRGQLRYVGQSTRGMYRPVNEMYKHLAHCRNWINKLKSLGLKPEIVVLEELSDNATADEIDVAEIEWIAMMRAIGCNLTNLTNGGGGLTGYKFSPEIRGKISKSLMGHPFSEESRKKSSISHLKENLKPETIIKMQRNKRGGTAKKPVIDLTTNISYESLAAASRATGIKDCYISDNLHKRSKTVKGHRFAFIEGGV